MSELKIPKGTKTISYSEYKGREDITRLIIPDGVEKIGYGAFCGCKNLSYVFIPKSVKRIESEAFLDCSSLEVVEGLKGVEYIQREAFNHTALKSITLPSGVTLGERPGFEYGYCFLIDALERIDVTPGEKGSYLSSKDGVLFDSYSKWESGLALACFPAARKGSYAVDEETGRIGGYAFYHTSLEEVTIPEGVKIVSWHAFDGAKNLKKIVFPTTLEGIGSFALANCPNLEEVIFQGTKIQVQESVFAHSPKLRHVVIPDAARLEKDWLKDAPDGLRVQTSYLTKKISESEFLSAIDGNHAREKADIVIAGVRAGLSKGVTTAEEVKRVLENKTLTAYFILCADILYEYGQYEKAFHFYLWHGDDLNRLMDCAEKISVKQEDLERVCLKLAEASGLGDPAKYHYSYMDSDFDENPYDPSHWEVHVTNYKYAFEILKEAAKEGNALCLRFLSIIPKDYESKIVNGETHCY